MEAAAADLADLRRAAVASHQRMWASASRMTDGDCRGPSLLPGWSRGHVLTHWARNADGQTRMLRAAMRGEIAAQYPGGDAQRDADIEAGAARPARQILDAGYTHRHWPGEFVDLMLPRILPTLAARLADRITVRVDITDRPPARTDAAAVAADDPVLVRGPASAVLCWLAGRPVPAAADLTVSRSGLPWPLPRLRPWA